MIGTTDNASVFAEDYNPSNMLTHADIDKEGFKLNETLSTIKMRVYRKDDIELRWHRNLQAVSVGRLTRGEWKGWQIYTVCDNADRLRHAIQMMDK